MKYLLTLLLLVSLVGCGSARGSVKVDSKSKSPAKVKLELPAEDPPVVNPTPPDPEPAPKPSPPPEPPPKPDPPVVPTIALPATLTTVPGAFLSIDAKTNCKRVRFRSPDAGLNVFPDGKLADPLGTVVSAVVPGQYRIEAVAAMGNEPVLSDWCIITVLGPQPPPVPPKPPEPPGPVPPAPPDPPAPVVTGPLKIVVIDNAAARTKVISALVGDVKYWTSVRTAGHSVWLIDSNNKAESAPFAPHITQAGGLPVVIFKDANNTLIAAVKLPADKAGMTALIAKYGGKAPVAVPR